MTGFSEKRSGELVYMRSGIMPDCVSHAFTTRFGGVSKGYLSSLNLGISRGDMPENVIKNYDIISSECGFDTQKLVFFRQVHGRSIKPVTFSDAFSPYGRALAEGDGAVTNEKGITLIVFTADCVPILLFDTEKEVIGAVHAGWRGTSAGIAEAAITAMTLSYDCRAENIRAAIGPSIGACCFETDTDVPEAMRGLLGAQADRFIKPIPDKEKFLVDVKGINRYVLILSGVLPENIDVSDECTVCRSDKYWSHRVTRGERGSQAAMIMLKR